MNLLDILQEKGIEYKSSNNPAEILVTCTSGDHEDSSPSLRYNMDTNIFHCFSCGFKGGSVKFLRSIGVDTKIPLQTKQEYKIAKLKEKIAKLNEVQIHHPTIETKVLASVKGIDLAVLQDFDGFYAADKQLEDYLWFPIKQFNRLRFVEGRLRFQDSSKPKYMRLPRGANVSDVLFPLDKIDRVNHVVLVEGLFDMLNLWQHGIRNVLCIFGTQNFGPKKVAMLDKIGIISVSIMMDGDPAGKKAAGIIASMLDKADIRSTIINLPDGKDPGILEKYEIDYYLKDNHA